MRYLHDVRSTGFGFGYVNHCVDYDDVGVYMSKIKKGDVIKCLSTSGYDFFAGCEYKVEKVDSQGFVYVYSDEGDKVAIDYPVCATYGAFKKS